MDTSADEGWILKDSFGWVMTPPEVEGIDTYPVSTEADARRLAEMWLLMQEEAGDSFEEFFHRVHPHRQEPALEEIMTFARYVRDNTKDVACCLGAEAYLTTHTGIWLAGPHNARVLVREISEQTRADRTKRRKKGMRPIFARVRLSIFWFGVSLHDYWA